jgi:DNA-binding transcriptional ArsR family regulator
METFKILETADLNAVSSPFRQQILQDLLTPGSAAGLARRYDMSRQRIGYHMRDLERAGCIEAVAERRQRGLTEKLYRTRPLAYVQAPPASDRVRIQDRFSWAALVNLVAGSLADLVALRRAADAAGKRLATLGLEAELHFETPRQRREFTEDLLEAVEGVLLKHERPRRPGSRAFRMILGAFPEPPDADAEPGAPGEESGKKGSDRKEEVRDDDPEN